jgi:hypothetical protein
VWLKLAGLAVIEVLLVWWLTTPIPSHAVMYDPARQPAPPVMPVFPVATQIAVYAAMLAVILIPVLAYWVFRRASQP